MQVIKRNGQPQEFDFNKIEKAIRAAFNEDKRADKHREDNIKTVLRVVKNSIDILFTKGEVTVELIQDAVEKTLMSCGQYDIAKSCILYREKHRETRFLKERVEYMEQYALSNKNAASSSETDDNANVIIKNVANLEGEVYKTTNRLIQRKRMVDKLKEMFPEIADKYEEDLNNHIIYVHDEASSPTLKPYCRADSLYPMMLEGTGPIDGVTPSAPNDIQSFSGQVTNLVFLLSSQVKGAVALGDYLIALNYYVIKEFGENWYTRLNASINQPPQTQLKTISSTIKKGMKQFIYGVNQPAGNRSYNSPFSNISIYDSIYFKEMFGEFYYPDGTKPEWKAIDTLQRLFIELLRELRLIKPLTFPVTTFAMVHDGKDIIDKEYKEFCSSEWAKGSSHFAFINNNPTALASCCRVLNEISDNTFSSTTGMTGVATGSANVITINLNRIIQKYCRGYFGYYDEDNPHSLYEDWIEHSRSEEFKEYLIDILERVYKYHIAYKTMLYDMEDAGMYSSSNADYTPIKKLYSTIGIIGYCEAAQYLGLEVSNNQEYKEFLSFIMSTIKECNKEYSIRDKKRPFLFNSEAVPGESLAIKLYDVDKKDGYYVPEDQNLYSSYFFKQWDNELSVLDKLALHGRYVAESCDGGQACHIHLEEHLSVEQYNKIVEYCVKEGVNYFTFNIPMSECKQCGHIVNAPIKECPKCGSKDIDYWVRIIGYLRPLSAYSTGRYKEATKRIYSTKENI